MTTPESSAVLAEKEVPIVQGGEDEPLFPKTSPSPGIPKDGALVEMDDIGKEITRFRYRTARKVLYIAMCAMGGAVALDLFANWLNLESSLINNAFEAFKLITMTVLGYIFGSNSSKSP